MRKFYIILIIVLGSKIAIGQNLSNENDLLWDYLSNSLKGIHLSIYDTLSENDRENTFVGNYLTDENNTNKKCFYIKFNSLKYSLDYSMRDTSSDLNNYDVFFIVSGAFKIGLILGYSNEENNICYGTFLRNSILLFDSVSNERYIIAIRSLFEPVEIPKKGLIIPPSPDDIEIVEYKINPELKSSNVYSVVKVNDKLEALSRIDFCNDRLISFSEISSPSLNYDRVTIYTCNETELFSSVSFFQFKRLFQFGTLKEVECSIRFEKLKNDRKPSWMNTVYSYD